MQPTLRLWTADEDDRLRTLYQSSRSDDEIGRLMDRSSSSVKHRAAAMRLKRRQPKAAVFVGLDAPEKPRSTPLTAEERGLFAAWDRAVLGSAVDAE